MTDILPFKLRWRCARLAEKPLALRCVREWKGPRAFAVLPVLVADQREAAEAQVYKKVSRLLLHLGRSRSLSSSHTALTWPRTM